MFRLFTFALLIISIECSSQNKHYTTANAHSHNDYEKQIPFYKAWENQFGSIEADIFLNNGKLVVAHDSIQLVQQRTLDSLYLAPLQLCIQKNGGFVYADKKRSLQLMIDIKSEAVSTLNKLVETIERFKTLNNTPSLKIVISGNRPASSQFDSYPSWILFDGELQKNYQQVELKKIVMFSDNFTNYSLWQGTGEIPEKDKQVLQQIIDKVHSLGKKIRFWNAPDTPDSWKAFIAVGVDYINTDKIDELTKFLNKN
jgi:alkaline phosphatase